VVSLPSIIQMMFYLGIPSLILFGLVAVLNSTSIQYSFSIPSPNSAASTTAWLQPYYQQRFLWMTDFSQPDQYHILAIIAGLLSSGLGLVMVRHTQAAFRRALSLYLLVLSPLSVSISFIIASGVALVWLLGYTVILTMQYGYAITGP
jgi:hypothetical protein